MDNNPRFDLIVSINVDWMWMIGLHGYIRSDCFVDHELWFVFGELVSLKLIFVSTSD